MSGEFNNMKKEPNFNIVLVRPEIPQNAGNIGRLCVNCDCRLHLIEPLGFSLEDKYLKRAGLDYWKHLDFKVHQSFDEFLQSEKPRKIFFFSTKAEKTLWECIYPPGSYLVFGNESSGLPPDLYEKYSDMLVKIPMPGKNSRSMNLANATAVALYEAIRQRQET